MHQCRIFNRHESEEKKLAWFPLFGCWISQFADRCFYMNIMKNMPKIRGKKMKLNCRVGLSLLSKANVKFALKELRIMCNRLKLAQHNLRSRTRSFHVHYDVAIIKRRFQDGREHLRTCFVFPFLPVFTTPAVSASFFVEILSSRVKFSFVCCALCYGSFLSCLSLCHGFVFSFTHRQFIK